MHNQVPYKFTCQSWVRNVRILFLFKNLRSTRTKKEHQQQQHQRVCAYLSVCLSGFRDILCRTMYVFVVPSCDILFIHGGCCTFPCVLYSSKSASVGPYLLIAFDPLHSVWPQIGPSCRFANPVHSQCYRLEMTLVGSYTQLQIGT